MHTSIQLPPIFQDLLSPTTTVTLSGELLSNSTGTYIDTLNIDLSATDNEGGTGIDKIYYAIGTDTGTLIYVPYTEPIIVNGVGNYTLSNDNGKEPYIFGFKIESFFYKIKLGKSYIVHPGYDLPIYPECPGDGSLFSNGCIDNINYVDFIRIISNPCRD